MAPTPAKSNQSQGTLIRTPQSKRLNFNSTKTPHPNPSPIPNTATKETQTTEHPVEVIGRIRDYPDRKDKPISALQLHSDHHSLRVRTDIGYRDFTLDGVSLSEDEDLDGFYKKFVQSRINGVKLGNKCTVMMYGPTGSGKSHTMFGCLKQPGIVYKSLRDILGGGDEGSDLDGVGTYVQVSVLEIYNEEIYDLLVSNTGGGLSSLGWSKGSASKVKLDVMGGKAKNATSITGCEAGKISKEIQKVEKRRIVKSTLCNERSSRSHCLIILDVPTVGGRLMLVDMAGSENIEQAGQIGFEAKMQTGKINQGNIALKRVVESIANGDSHVPFRDSKLTMLLQDSFEDDKSKILMILCASPDPKEMHKTISTLEYGAKAKCIIRGPHTPNDTTEGSSSQVILGSRIAAMDQFIYKLQMENKLREKERNEAHKALLKKEEEVAALRAKLENVGPNENEINMKVNERTLFLKHELEKKLQECQKMAEEKIRQKQEEVERLRQRLAEIESQLSLSRGGTEDLRESSGIAKRLMEIYAGEDPGMEKSMDLAKSMDLDMGDQESFDHKFENFTKRSILDHPSRDQVILSTVFEEEEAENEDKLIDEEVEKEIVEDKMVCSSSTRGLKRDMATFAATTASPRVYLPPLNPSCRNPDDLESSGMVSQETSRLLSDDYSKDASSSRRMRIQNIFTLCGNYRELSQQIKTPAKNEVESFEDDASAKKFSREILQLQKSGAAISRQSPEILKKLEESQMNRTRKSNEIGVESKENHNPASELNDSSPAEVYVKWETSKDNPGKFITKLKVVKSSSLADLRKLIEIQLGVDAQAFNFLLLGDPSGAAVSKEKEAMVQVSKLPICNNQLNGHLVCLRPIKGVQRLNNSPFGGSLENRLPLALTPVLHI